MLPPSFDAESALPNPAIILQRMLHKFERRAKLDDDDREALLSLPYRVTKAEPGRYLVREGAATDHSIIILSGLAYRHKFTAEGSRQIVSIHIPGDFVDLEGALLNISDHNVQALNSMRACDRPQICASRVIRFSSAHRARLVGRYLDRRLDLPRVDHEHRAARRT